LSSYAFLPLFGSAKLTTIHSTFELCAVTKLPLAPAGWTRALYCICRSRRHGCKKAPNLQQVRSSLVRRERLLAQLDAGRSNADIASDLIVSVNTVKAHIKNIYRKLNVGNRL